MFNVYLVEDVLIDAATRWARWRILSQLRNRPVRMVALTHCHPDHQGTAKIICERFGVPLACHAADTPTMEGRAPMEPLNCVVRMGERFWSGPPHPVGQVLRDGDMVAGFRVVHTPGHTSGHVVFFRERDRVAIVGDLLANIHFLTGRPGLREPPAYSCIDPAQNRRSMQILLRLNPAIVCFGHGPPLTDCESLKAYISARAMRRDRHAAVPVPTEV
jgi:glyoxylase-like metal-dependent hydrolase (beta-lactamase superfamily II)